MSLGRKLGLGVRVTFSGHSCVPGFGGVCAEGGRARIWVNVMGRMPQGQVELGHTRMK